MAKLACPLCCNLHFDDLNALRSSLVAATTAEIQCPVCQETQRGLDKFTIHLFTHVADEQPNVLLKEPAPLAPVPVIGSKAAASNANIEISQVIAEAPSIEKAVAAGIEEQITNVQSEIANEQRTIRCDICSFTFSDENILDMHQKLLHQTLEDKQTGLYSYHCHLCSKKFKMKGSLMVHLRVAHYGFGHNNKIEHDLVASLSKLKKKTDSSKNEDQTKKWYCDVCQKLFTTKYFLKKHKRLHTGEMPYFCAQCNKHFTFQQTYRKHMLYHTAEKPHVCQECGRAFKELSTLHNHERIHSGERPFACEFCGKCFRQRVSYLVHKRIHTGVMPYKCTACGKSYRYKVSQRSHKCPAIPPGDVIKTPEITTSSNILTAPRESVKDNLNLNLSPINIVFNTDGQIIGQNFTYNGQNLITFHNLPLNAQDLSDESKTQRCEEIMPKVMEFYPMAEQNSLIANNCRNDINTVRSDVALLTTHSSALDSIPRTSSKLQTINEESLKQMLYGAGNISEDYNWALRTLEQLCSGELKRATELHDLAKEEQKEIDELQKLRETLGKMRYQNKLNQILKITHEAKLDVQEKSWQMENLNKKQLMVERKWNETKQKTKELHLSLVDTIEHNNILQNLKNLSGDKVSMHIKTVLKDYKQQGDVLRAEEIIVKKNLQLEDQKPMAEKISLNTDKVFSVGVDVEKYVNKTQDLRDSVRPLKRQLEYLLTKKQEKTVTVEKCKNVTFSDSQMIVDNEVNEVLE